MERLGAFGRLTSDRFDDFQLRLDSIRVLKFLQGLSAGGKARRRTGEL
jgi:hypothetical protein